MTSNKKLAFAVAAALSVGTFGVAHAADVASAAADGVDTFSIQGLNGVTDPVDLSDVNVTLAAEYTAQDTISFRIAGADLDADAAAAATITCDDTNGIAGPDLTVGFLSVSGNTINYRVTVVEANSSTIGTTCTISGLAVDPASLATGDEITATWLATTVGGAALDRGGDTTATVAEVIDQFSSEVTTALDGIIDVNAQREEFEGAANDLLTVTLTDDSADVDGSVGAATDTARTLKVNGNFSYLIDNGGADETICEVADLAGAVAANNGGAIDSVADDCSSITFTVNTGATTVTFTPPGGVVLPVQTFSGSVDWTYDNAEVTDEVETETLAGVGEWVLNGASVYINYMPYGANISQIIYAANKGAQSGEITVDAFNSAGATCSFSAGTLDAGTTKQLAGDIRSGLEACTGFLDANGSARAAMTVTVNVPAADVEVYSAYNVGGSDRGTVVNSSNGK